MHTLARWCSVEEQSPLRIASCLVVVSSPFPARYTRALMTDMPRERHYGSG